MLEQFHVPADEEVRVNPDAMRQTVHDIFTALGMSDEHARSSTDVLLYADTRGIDSHGVSNMLRVYVDGIREGRINVNPQWKITHEAAAVATIDSDGAHGGVIGPEAMKIAIERARLYGIGAVSVYHGGHYGAAAYTAAAHTGAKGEPDNPRQRNQAGNEDSNLAGRARDVVLHHEITMVFCIMESIVLA